MIVLLLVYVTVTVLHRTRVLKPYTGKGPFNCKKKNWPLFSSHTNIEISPGTRRALMCFYHFWYLRHLLNVGCVVENKAGFCSKCHTIKNKIKKNGKKFASRLDIQTWHVCFQKKQQKKQRGENEMCIWAKQENLNSQIVFRFLKSLN